MGIWAIAGLLLILSEFFIPQFVVFFFGAGALINAALLALIPSLADRIPLQFVIWAFTSSLSLALLRRYAAKWFRGKNTADGEDADAGKTAEVIETISPDAPGRIRYRGTTWKAISYDETISVGSTVTILKKENLSYLVASGDLLGDGSDV